MSRLFYLFRGTHRHLFAYCWTKGKYQCQMYHRKHIGSSVYRRSGTWSTAGRTTGGLSYRAAAVWILWLVCSLGSHLIAQSSVFLRYYFFAFLHCLLLPSIVDLKWFVWYSSLSTFFIVLLIYLPVLLLFFFSFAVLRFILSCCLFFCSAGICCLQCTEIENLRLSALCTYI